MRHNVVNKFNRGELDPRVLDRDDIEKILNSCELMSNWIPMRLGPMQYRPGTLNLGVLSENSFCIPFVSSATDTAEIEISNSTATVWIDDELLTRPTSTLTIANPSFTSGITGWTNASTGAAIFSWNSSGAASLKGTASASAKMWQTFGGTISDTGIIITIEAAPLIVYIGTGGVDTKNIFSGTLGVGTHSLFITSASLATLLPTITVINPTQIEGRVSQISIASSGIVSVPLPESITDINSIRYAQSADVLFIATDNTIPFRIERRGVKTWSIVEYRADDGPFDLINNTSNALRVSALSGDITLSSTEILFDQNTVGKLYKLTSAGQVVESSVTAEDKGTDSIRVTGITAARKFHIEIQGTFVGMVNLQRSVDNEVWIDVPNASYSNTTSANFSDDIDNAIYYYRLWVKVGRYTSGTIILSLTYTSGSIDGICRVTQYLGPTTVAAQTLKSFGSLGLTADWYPGEWSPGTGYPSSVALYEGRLWWAGKTKLWGSVSDKFSSFDSSVEGSSAPVRRTVGFGPVDTVNWLAPSSRLLMGIASDEISVRSSQFGEVLTNTNCNLKSGSTQGVAPIDALKVDDSIYYVHRSGIKVMETEYSMDKDTHIAKDLMITHPNICIDGIKRFIVVRQPETRTYVLLNTGELRVYLVDQAEDISAWSRIITDGVIDDISMLPGTPEDAVYLTVIRDGIRYKEKVFDLGDATTRYFDNAELLTDTSSLTITGLSRFNGSTVGAWGVISDETEGHDLGDFTVSGGQIIFPVTYSTLLIGKRYTADYKCGKLSGYMPTSVLGTLKRIVGLGFSLIDYLPGALQVGPDFDLLENMPEDEGVTGKGITGTELIDNYDELPFEFNGDWQVDPRICVRASYPCTIISMVYDVLQDDDKAGDKA